VQDEEGEEETSLVSIWHASGLTHMLAHNLYIGRLYSLDQWTGVD